MPTWPHDRPSLDPHPLSPYVAWAGTRNREPILKVLEEWLPREPGHVLELASGSGMHIHFFAPRFPELQFQPSDADPSIFDHIQSLTRAQGATNVAAPVRLDLTDPATWDAAGDREYTAIFCINIFQVAPLSIADSMMRCAAQLLGDDGRLFIYGPFKVNGEYTTTSNEEFDFFLLATGVPEWGLKDIRDISAAAKTHGLALVEVIGMPMNNFMLVYERAR